MISSYSLSSLHLQLAMERYYYGPEHGISTDSLSFLEVVIERDRSFCSLLSVDARICQGPSLCLRIQSWAIIGRSGIDGLHRIDLCIHHDTADKTIPQTLQCKSDAYNQAIFTKEPYSLECRACGIEFQLEISNSENEDRALVITKWLNLGSSPSDEKWTRHHKYGHLDLKDPIPSIGQTRSRFEMERGQSYDELTARNKSLLIGKSFKKDFPEKIEPYVFHQHVDCTGRVLELPPSGRRRRNRRYYWG
ncbi:hypothetical protein FQN57_003887 [Myotisia sp. PD_48]|nr:hypothetical protein FQN57_003887 [Myotisia sp. PD_48]